MTGDGVHSDDMDFERGADDALGTFFDDVRAAAADVPAPLAGAALTTLFEDGALPASVVTTPPRPAWRRSRRTLRVVIAGAVGGLAFGGLGVAGALPGPVQSRVADVVDVVGVHLPDGHPAPTTTTEPPTAEVGPRTGVTGDDHQRGDDRVGTTTTVEPSRENSDDRRGRDGGSSGSDDGSGSGRTGTTSTTGDDHRGGDDGSGSGRDTSGDGSGSTEDHSGSGGHGSSDIVVPDTSGHGSSGSGSGSGHD